MYDKRMRSFKRLLALPTFLFVLAVGPAHGAAQPSAYLPPIIDLLLQDDSGSNSSPGADTPVPPASVSLGTLQLPHLANADAGLVPQGKGSVKQGEALYDVPIVVPPGVNGMTPNLSIHYGSGEKNGLLGIGWSLSGLSSIHRCGLVFAINGATGPVGLGTSDKLCWNGRQLLLAKGTDYWAADAEYRLEIDDFSRVRRSGNGFLVQTKDGLQHIFGQTADSIVEAQGSTAVLSWALSRSSDRSGNFIRYKYTENTAEGEIYPAEVAYGTTGTGSEVVIASVKFEYKVRSDILSGYLGGAKSKIKNVLSKVTTYAESTVASTYSLEYRQSRVSGDTLLQTVSVCARNPVSGATECVPSTKFEWNDAAIAAASIFKLRATTPLADINVSSACALSIGDFNNDGKSDLLTNSKGFYTGIAGGFEYRTVTGLPVSCYDGRRVVGDFNGDGASDLMIAKDSFIWTTCLSDGQANPRFSCTDSPRTDGTEANYFGQDGFDVLPIGIRGNGKNALFFSSGKACEFASNNTLSCNGVRNVVGGLGSFIDYPYYASKVAYLQHDMNGDDSEDVLKAVFRPSPDSDSRDIVLEQNLCQFKGGNAAGAELACQYQEYTGAPSDFFWEEWSSPDFSVDINGDGLVDHILGTERQNGQTLNLLCLSRGTGSSDCSPISRIGAVGDFDGSGRIGLLTMDKSSLCYWSGAGLQCRPVAIPGFEPIRIDPYDTPPGPIFEMGIAVYSMPNFQGNGKTALLVADRNQNLRLFSMEEGTTRPEKIVAAVDGLGRRMEIDYAEPGDSSVYQAKAVDVQDAAIPHVYPQRELATANYPVKAMRYGNGQGGWLETRYRYFGAAFDQQGRGHLGFARIETTDVTSGLRSVDIYAQGHPYTGMLKQQRVFTTGGAAILDSSYTLDRQVLTQANGQTTVFPYTRQSRVSRQELNGANMETTTTVNSYGDGWGNLTQQDITVTGDGNSYLTSISTVYRNDSTNWLLGLATRRTVSKTRDGITVPRVMAYDYDAKGLLSSETVEPDDTSLLLKLATIYDRSGNAFGLVNKRIQTWWDQASSKARSRTPEDVVYEAKGRFPQVVKNALGQAETRTYAPATGALLSVVDPNQLTTRWEYDGFGRKTREVRADGTESRYYFKQCPSGCPAYAASVAIVDHLKGAERIAVPSLVYSDNAGHVVRSQSYGFDGRVVVSDSRYDSRGRLWEEDQPRYLDQSAVLEQRYAYDALDRVVRLTVRDEGGVERSATTDYQGFTITRTNAKGYKKVDVNDALGLLAQTTDGAGVLNVLTRYKRDPFGNLSQTIDANGNVIKVEYDKLGRKTDLRDPDLGWIHYDVDPLGLVWKETDPRLRAATQSTRTQYDDLDRPIVRFEPDLESHWIYDHATTAGQCASTKSCGLLVESYAGTPSVKDYRRLQTYDSLGRPSTTTTLLDTSYAVTQAYDAWGRPGLRTIQRRDGAVKGYDHRYNAMGYLVRIERGSLVLWQANAQDASNRVLQASLGNGLLTDTVYNPNTGRLTSDTLKTAAGAVRLQEGYQYDMLGNMAQRSQYWNGSTGFMESFGYDALNRLENSTVSGKPQQVFAYDAIGNLKSKTGVGSGAYVYPAQGATALLPHAVQSIPGIGTFTYDANGNLTSGAGRTITWTSFDMPKKIIKGSVSSEFSYGPEHLRTKQVKSDGTTIYYAGNQEVESKSGVTTIRTYWPGGVGIEVDTTSGSTTTTTQTWVHTDRLGSVIAFTDPNGNLKENLAYDAWGKRRTLDGASTPDALEGLNDNKGFTGHEMLDGLDLVHMNGRIYDPLVARFMSADPIIQAPEYGQSYNRYTYVWNNPTNLTDPTGFEADGADNDSDSDGESSGGVNADTSSTKSETSEPKAGASDYEGDWVYSDGRRVAGYRSGTAGPPPGAVGFEPAESERISVTGNHRASSSSGGGWSAAKKGGVANSSFKSANSDKGWWSKATDAFANVFKGVANNFWLQASAMNGDPDAIRYFEDRARQDQFTSGFAAGVAAVDDFRQGGPRAAGTLAGNVVLGTAVKGVMSRSNSAVLLADANRARDIMIEVMAKRPRSSRPQTVTAGYNTKTGQVVAAACGSGECAEAHVVKQLGGDKSVVRFTQAMRVNEARRGISMQQPICAICEGEYGRSPFPAGTIYQSDSW